MKINKAKRNNIIFFVIIVLLIIPQTRQPIQVFLHKGLAMFSPSVVKEDERKLISNYNWQLMSVDGEAFNLNEARGKVVLINFWATWCPPCIAEMPKLQALYNDYNEQVEFLFVTNENMNTVNRFLTKHNYNFKVYIASETFPEFNIKSIPRTILVDKSAYIIIDKTGASNWNSKSVRTQIDYLLLD